MQGEMTMGQQTKKRMKQVLQTDKEDRDDVYLIKYENPRRIHQKKWYAQRCVVTVDAPGCCACGVFALCFLKGREKGRGEECYLVVAVVKN